MTSTSTLNVDWSTIGVVAGLCSLIIGVAVTYLKLFIATKMSTMEKDIITAIRLEYANKEVIDSRFSDIYRRLENLERPWDGHDRRKSGGGVKVG